MITETATGALRSLFEWVDALPSSVAIRESLDLYSWILTSHVVTMTMFAGLVLMMDLPPGSIVTIEGFLVRRRRGQVGLKEQ